MVNVEVIRNWIAKNTSMKPSHASFRRISASTLPFLVESNVDWCFDSRVPVRDTHRVAGIDLATISFQFPCLSTLKKNGEADYIKKFIKQNIY